MTTDHDHDPDPDATVKMPRPAPKKEDLEDVDPDSTLIREDWGTATIQPPPAGTPVPPGPSVPAQHWDRTLRRPAYTPEQESP